MKLKKIAPNALIVFVGLTLSAGYSQSTLAPASPPIAVAPVLSDRTALPAPPSNGVAGLLPSGNIAQTNRAGSQLPEAAYPPAGASRTNELTGSTAPATVAGETLTAPVQSNAAQMATQPVDDGWIRVYAQPELTPQLIETAPVSSGSGYYRGGGYGRWNRGRVLIGPGRRLRRVEGATKVPGMAATHPVGVSDK